MTNRTATYSFRTFSSGPQHVHDNREACDYVTTEILTETHAGIRVETTVIGTYDGEPLHQVGKTYHGQCTFEAACAYRETHGYTKK